MQPHYDPFLLARVFFERDPNTFVTLSLWYVPAAILPFQLFERVNSHIMRSITTSILKAGSLDKTDGQIKWIEYPPSLFAVEYRHGAERMLLHPTLEEFNSFMKKHYDF